VALRDTSGGPFRKEERRLWQRRPLDEEWDARPLSALPQKLWERVVGFEPRRGDRDFQQRDQLTPTRLCFNARGQERLPSIGDHDDITGLEVWRGMLEKAEVVAGRVVKAVDGHRASSIDRSVAKSEAGREGVVDESGQGGGACLPHWFAPIE
jgi:hypothetical protein